MIPIIDRVQDPAVRARAIQRCRERGIILPTFAELRDPSLVPGKVRNRLRGIGLWDLDPLNLFRITWQNEPKEHGGLYGGVNAIELPPSLTGVPARIVALVGKWFPTGAHKVGAAYGCLAPTVVSGGFDPTRQKAVWPSTGNYCRGGAFDSYLMGCTAVAILPEEMSRERFEWLREIGAEVIATSGCESNVKEIYDKCWELRRTRADVVIFNQFAEFGNAVWHYHCTGSAIEQAVERTGARLAGFVSATGSAGTIAAGDYLRTIAPAVKVVATEALQCPTLLRNGFGGHRIEGIGDKHVPWIHNVRNTDAVAAIDDEDCLRLLRLFNEPAGREALAGEGVPAETIAQLPLLGISSLANLLAAIKTARWFELAGDDVVATVATDSVDLYRSRLAELAAERGPYTAVQAARDLERSLLGQRTDHFKELTHPDRRALHNLKYYTWVEQQAMDVRDLESLWYDRALWSRLFAQPARWDEMIAEFNAETGLLAGL
ncbi:MAG TPA: pyridoxal-phosphate dependent enzyme [Candidatus Krumholzibacteria bacterium]|nr:pyridoxal-phosphate dependent enzyme [Candidatus Krumholzibacteria bacterium]HPD73045.1 pyridoxal-phosphate dependent enzyme [Candidatus Krumholzibacteria bacterium]HRY41844.1 pyridoxal-phosphate dependent enzyme [Candidatus Krumholzibacteria bacterium]